MRAKLQNMWDNLKASLWFVPTGIVVLSALLAITLLEVDAVLFTRGSKIVTRLVGGTPDAARTLLAVIAGTLVTVISITVSITILALQQTSLQFTPRMLRTFTSDAGNQIVLGMYSATFLYSLLVMREIQDATDPNVNQSFIPAISIVVALGLGVVCLGLLLYFVHHISQLLQVSVVMDRVHDELVEEIGDRYETGLGAGVEDPPPALELVEQLEPVDQRAYVRSREAGFLRSVDEQTLVEASDGKTPWLWVRPQPGDYVPHGGVLAEFPSDVAFDDEQLDQLRGAFVLDSERSMRQDPLFGIRQLVDIALKALSPAINDPTTAEYSLSHLGDALGHLAERRFPPTDRMGPGGATRYIWSQPAWDDFVEAAFGQIRRQAWDNVHVTAHMLRVLNELATCVPPGSRGQAVRREVEEIRYVLDGGKFSPVDTAMLRRECDRVDEVLQLSAPMAVRV